MTAPDFADDSLPVDPATFTGAQVLQMLKAMEERLEEHRPIPADELRQMVDALDMLHAVVLARFAADGTLFEALERVCRLAKADGVLLQLLNNRGLLRRSRGELQAAREDFREAVAIAERSPSRRHLASCLHNLGMLCLATGEPAVAVAHLERALAAADGEKDPGGLGQILSNLGLCLLRLGFHQRALEYFLRALGVPGQDLSPYDDSLLRLNVGSAFFELGVPTAARRWHDQVVAWEGLSSHPQMALRAWYVRGCDRAALQDHGGALEDYLRCLSVVEQLAALADLPPNERGELCERAVNAALQGGQTDVALWVVERARQLRRPARARAPSLGIGPTAADFVRGLQEALPTGPPTALITFTVGTEQTLVFVVLPNQDPRDTVVRLPGLTRQALRAWTFHEWFAAQMRWRRDESEFDAFSHTPSRAEHEQAYLQALQRWRQTIRRASGWLADNVFAYPDPVTNQSVLDLLRTAQIERLLLVPSQHLWLLPLHLAHCPSAAGGEFLLDAFELSFLPAAALVQAPAYQATGDDDAVLVIDPQGNLPGAELEARLLASILPGARQLRSRGAGAGAVLSALKRARHMHFACHTDVPRHASHLGLVLADECLPAARIRSLDLSHTESVVLSACESAFVEFGPGEDYVGLPGAFLEAGARYVSATLWRLADISTPLLMHDFYHLLHIDRLAPAAALRQAQRRIRRLTAAAAADELGLTVRQLQGELVQELSPEDCPFADPFWWGAFQVIGRGW
jgi:CHAT domain-containing protein